MAVRLGREQLEELRSVDSPTTGNSPSRGSGRGCWGGDVFSERSVEPMQTLRKDVERCVLR